MRIGEFQIYYGLFSKDVTLGYDSNGYKVLSGLPQAETKTAYYTTASWDRGVRAAHSKVQYNTTLSRFGIDYKSIDANGYVYPVFTIADAIVVQRNENEHEETPIFHHWCAETNAFGDPQKLPIVSDSEETQEVSETRSTQFLEPDDYYRIIDPSTGKSYEMRENTVLFARYKYAPVTVKDTSKSILTGDQFSLKDEFAESDAVDTGHKYRTSDTSIAKVTQQR